MDLVAATAPPGRTHLRKEARRIAHLVILGNPHPGDHRTALTVLLDSIAPRMEPLAATALQGRTQISKVRRNAYSVLLARPHRTEHYHALTVLLGSIAPIQGPIAATALQGRTQIWEARRRAYCVILEHHHHMDHLIASFFRHHYRLCNRVHGSQLHLHRIHHRNQSDHLRCNPPLTYHHHQVPHQMLQHHRR